MTRASCPTRGALPILGVLLFLLSTACQRGPASNGSAVAAAAGTPVILISIDTLRSDRLPAYGYTGVATPAIDELRDDSVLFTRAFSHVPLTLPAHASMLTGRMPYEHGIRDNQGYVLDDTWPTLPELLGARGYRTGAAVSAFILRRETGIDRGFDFFEDRIEDAPANQLVSPLRPGRATLDATSAWLDEVAGGPFFLFFHIYEPHLPYEPDEPSRERYGVTYDAEVATADRVIGDLLQRLRDSGAYDRSLIVLTSDHGEGLGDHGLIEHGPLLYREALQVPLLIKLPQGVEAPRTSDRPAQLVDLFPTILHALGTPWEGEPMTGVALLGAHEAAGRTLYGETLFPRLHFGWSDLYSAIDYPYHLIDGPDPELYDLENDPEELHNILDDNRRVYRRLTDHLAALPRTFTAPGPVDDETRAKLAALGYLGATRPADDAGSLADPKAKLHVLRALSEALARFQAGDCWGTIDALEAVIADEPAIIEAWDQIGVCQMRLGRFDASLEAYEQLLELTGGGAKAAFGAATALFALNRDDEARDLAETAVPLQPGAYTLLAKIALRAGELDAAQEALTQALRSAVGRPDALLAQAELLLAREQPDAALARIDEAEAAAQRPLRGLTFIRGQALARLGDVEAATRAFTQAIEETPTEIPPYTHLALLRGLAGDGDGALRALQALTAVRDAPEAYAEAVRTLGLLGNQEGAERLLAYARSRWPGDPGLRSF